jgi:hypothetical protein
VVELFEMPSKTCFVNVPSYIGRHSSDFGGYGSKIMDPLGSGGMEWQDLQDIGYLACDVLEAMRIGFRGMELLIAKQYLQSYWAAHLKGKRVTFGKGPYRGRPLGMKRGVEGERELILDRFSFEDMAQFGVLGLTVMGITTTNHVAQPEDRVKMLIDHMSDERGTCARHRAVLHGHWEDIHALSLLLAHSDPCDGSCAVKAVMAFLSLITGELHTFPDTHAICHAVMGEGGAAMAAYRFLHGLPHDFGHGEEISHVLGERVRCFPLLRDQAAGWDGRTKDMFVAMAESQGIGWDEAVARAEVITAMTGCSARNELKHVMFAQLYGEPVHLPLPGSVRRNITEGRI